MKTAKWKLAVASVILVLVGMAFAWSGPLTSLMPKPASASPVLFSEDTVISIYDTASPAVVEINVTQGTGGLGGFFNQGLGSGFLVDKDGYFLTNQHVVDGASKVSVTFKDGHKVTASVAGTDTIHDLALVKVDPSSVNGLTPLQFGDSDAVKPGQMAIALGAPFGLSESITVGVISGLGRSLSGGPLGGMLQTDAAINPGNSGGPLLNSSGDVIGINTAVEAQAGANGIGFAVASNVAKLAIPTLKSGIQIQRAWLGITGTTLTQDLASQAGISASQGVYVIKVSPGSPAEKAGLKGSGTGSSGSPNTGGDVITAADGKAMSTINDLTNYLGTKQVGNEVTLSVLHEGTTINIKVILGTWPNNLIIGGNPTPQPQPQPNIPNPWSRRPRQDNQTPED